MSRNAKGSLIKPRLEGLEERIQPASPLVPNSTITVPSFLLNGAVAPLAAPLNNMSNDMKSAAADLKTQFSNLQTNTLPSPGSSQGAEQVVGKMIADWQRILNDSAAITATANVDMTFIRTAAFTELQAGNAADAVLLLFGPMIGFEPTSAITNPVSQANSTLTDLMLQSIVNQNLHTVNSSVDLTVPISQEVIAPAF
jgi:hypothetical protein